VGGVVGGVGLGGGGPPPPPPPPNPQTPIPNPHSINNFYKYILIIKNIILYL